MAITLRAAHVGQACLLLSGMGAHQGRGDPPSL
jgi:hypothetical protein